jgi:DNA-binding NtrC family response regulator
VELEPVPPVDAQTRGGNSSVAERDHDGDIAASAFETESRERASRSFDGGLVLVADDDAEVRSLLGRWLRRAGYDVELFPDGAKCLSALSRTLPDAICLDLDMPELSGLDTLEKVRSLHRFLPVVILTGDASIDSAVAAMRLGAFDYLTKPISHADLVTRVRNAVERNRLSVRVTELEREASGQGYSDLVGSSEAMKRLFRHLDRLSTSDITVLIHGESGTGKELVARAVHSSSGRAGGPFVALNCAAIPETLQESELFGHERGAFTGASRSRPGRFEQADGGTLFLDEVAELSLPLQAKLLRVLQEKSFHRLGGAHEVFSDFRLIAATHQKLEAEVAAGRFREDLFFRIAVFELPIPALRERTQDIPALIQRFLDELQVTETTVDPDAMEQLCAYPWPGNVRELRNVIETAILMSSGGRITGTGLPERLLRRVEAGVAPNAADAGEGHGSANLPVRTDAESKSREGNSGPQVPLMRLDELERLAIVRALAEKGNLSQVARVLGISRNTLYRKLDKYGLR